MRSFVIVLICLSALGFVLAAASTMVNLYMLVGVSPEGFSFASTNLSLLAIAFSLCFNVGKKE